MGEEKFADDRMKSKDYWLGQRDAFTAIANLKSLFSPAVIKWVQAQANMAERERRRS